MRGYLEAALTFCLLGCAHAHTEPQLIGTATMAPDHSIRLQLVSRECDGTLAHGDFVVQPNASNYAEILRHIGGLEPGQSKPVSPWPAPPCR